MSWKKVPLAKVAAVESGFGFPREHQGQSQGAYPFFKVSDMNLPGNEVEMRRVTNTVSQDVLDQLGAKAFAAGTVIFPKIGAAIATEKKRLLTCPATFDNNVMGVVPDEVLVPKFLYYWFLTIELQRIANIGPVPSLRKSEIQQLAFPLVAPSEQGCIVEILDQADALRKLCAAADAKAERILPAVFYKMFGDPASWSVEGTSPLGELVDPISGATPSKANPEYWVGNVPWVSPKDIREEVLHDAEDHVSEPAINETNLKLVPAGTAVIVVRGMILARTVPVAITAVTVTINQDMKALLPKNACVDGLYIYTLLRVLRSQLLGAVATAAHGTRKLDTDLLLSTRVFVPEDRALAKFHGAAEEVLRLIARQRERHRLLDKLFEVLLHRAFSGDLTAKWREAHMQELLVEMEQQAKSLDSSCKHPIADFPDDRAS